MNRKEFEKNITYPSEEEADKLLVAETADAMLDKLAIKRQQGRSGWWNVDYKATEFLAMANEHFDKVNSGDFGQIIDCINLLAMARMVGEWESKKN